MSSLARALSVAILFGTAGQAAAVDNAGAVNRALSALRQNPAATRTTPADAFVSRDVIVDRNGTEHVRLDRTYKGLPVIGGDMVVHSRAGGFKKASVALKAPINVGTTPTLTSADAIDHAGVKFGTKFEAVPTARLVIYAHRKVPALAYDVLYVGKQKDGTPTRMHYYVDAKTGAILGKQDAVQTGTLPGTGLPGTNPPTTPNVRASTGTGRSLMAGSVPVYGQYNLDRRYYELKDPTRGNTRITDFGNGFYGNAGGLGTQVIDGDNKWGNGTNSDRVSAAVDAAYGFSMTWDFFKQKFNRNGIADDGRGALGGVHYLNNYSNAFWSNDCFCMAFGDGDGVTIRPLVAIDIMGHEMAHGVTWSTAGLMYEKESGGLNEATSDILGAMVEYFANNAAQPPNYMIGEAIYLPVAGNPPALRSMFKPSLDGISDDCFPDGSDPAYLDFFKNYKDVHYTSGVANHFFYLLAEGAVVPAGADTEFELTPEDMVCNANTGLVGIGREAATQIWYRALTVYMVSDTDYAGARAATISAATDLYGTSAPQNVAAVAAAWDAVNVL
jgi:Zn-dependent metalloprotease